MFTPKDKSAKEGALKKLMALMDKGDHEELKGLKKPGAAVLDVTAEPDADDDHTDVGELSPQEKALIAAHRSTK